MYHIPCMHSGQYIYCQHLITGQLLNSVIVLPFSFFFACFLPPMQAYFRP
jgi:hypothetical protein